MGIAAFQTKNGRTVYDGGGIMPWSFTWDWEKIKKSKLHRLS